MFFFNVWHFFIYGLFKMRENNIAYSEFQNKYCGRKRSQALVSELSEKDGRELSGP